MRSNCCRGVDIHDPTHLREKPFGNTQIAAGQTIGPLGEEQGKASARQDITQAPIPSNVRFMEVN